MAIYVKCRKMNIKKYFYSLVLSLITLTFFGQSLPANRYHVPYLLDQVSVSPSFAYSLRKLSRGYTGFAVKIRRSTDNAEANVSFNNNDIVANDSQVIITSQGSSSLTVGQKITYSAFVGASNVFVTTWYDQGANAYNAIQTINANQPRLVLNSAGSSNTLPSILYNGAVEPDCLVVNQPIQNLINSGINGSFMLLCKPTQNTDQHSFGMRSASNWRWSIHINWSDEYCYFDASEECCATNRRFYNSSSLNIYKQYSFVRGTAYKTIRLNNVVTTLNNASATSYSQTGGAFYLGSWGATNAKGFYGNAPEAILFPTDLATSELDIIERNQMNFWL